MRQRVDARDSRQALRQLHHQLRVDDRHVRRQRVVGQRELLLRHLVRDHRERRHLGARAGRGRNRHEIRLLAHLGEGVNALADIAETHRHIHEVGFRMLVEHPHDLRRVHRGAAADGDDAVRLEGGHLRGAFLGAAQGRVRRDVGEGLMHDAHRIELVGNRLGVAVVEEERVGHDEGALFAHHRAQFVQRHRQAALFEVYLLRRAEPKHVLSPLRHGLDVDQMLDTHVLAHGVAAPGAAA